MYITAVTAPSGIWRSYEFPYRLSTSGERWRPGYATFDVSLDLDTDPFALINKLQRLTKRLETFNVLDEVQVAMEAHDVLEMKLKNTQSDNAAAIWHAIDGVMSEVFKMSIVIRKE